MSSIVLFIPRTLPSSGTDCGLLAFALCSILHPASSHAAFDIIDDSGNTVEFHSKIVKNTDGIINDDLSTITFSFVSVDSNGVKQPPQTLGSLNNPIYTFSELKSAATRENIKGHAKILGALVVFAATSEAATIVISTVGLGEAFTAAVFGKLPILIMPWILQKFLMNY